MMEGSIELIDAYFLIVFIMCIKHGMIVGIKEINRLYLKMVPN